MTVRWVVVDLNVLWNRPEKLPLRDCDRIVLPHAIIGDILKSPDRKRHQKSFENFFKHFQQQIYVARDWGEIQELESKPPKLISDYGWCDFKISRILQNLVTDEEVGWNTIQSSSIITTYEQLRRDFLTRCEKLAETIKGFCPEKVKAVESKGVIPPEFIHDRSQPYHLLGVANFDHHARESPEYKLAVTHYSDEWSVSRLNKLIIINAFRFAAKQTKDWVKNFDDTRYAFAASYAGNLLTSDRRVKDNVDIAFPGKISVIH